MRIGLIYFSPTENTAKIAEKIKDELKKLNIEVDESNITNFSDRQKKFDIEQYEALFLGFPIHAWRAPKLIREWLQTLDGKGKKCSVFFTYGGVSAGVAHYDIKQILEKQNFMLVSTAEFLGKHTYNLSGWKLMEGRPNQSDFDVTKEYILKTYERFKGEDSGIVNFKKHEYNENILDRIEKTSNKVINPPSRENKECSMCRKCEELCPTNAMDADLGEADQTKCIRCLRCIANCPDNILKVNDLRLHFKLIAKMEKLTDEILNNRESRIFL